MSKQIKVYEKLEELCEREPALAKMMKSDGYVYVSEKFLRMLEKLVDQNDEYLEIINALANEAEEHE